jgi:hypothetical protein
LGSELSGWLVLQIPRSEIQAGLIVLKLHTWYEPRENDRTRHWTSINNIDAEDMEIATAAPAEGNETTDGSTRQRQLVKTPTRHAFRNRSIFERRARSRSYQTPPLCRWFQFEYVIDGVVTKLDTTAFLEQKKDIQSMVEVLTLMDDGSFASRSSSAESGSDNDNDVLEVAIRIRGCGHGSVFGVTHLYWA